MATEAPPAPAAAPAAPATPPQGATPDRNTNGIIHRPPGDRTPALKPATPAADGKEPSRLDRMARFADTPGPNDRPAAEPAPEVKPAAEPPTPAPDKPASTEPPAATPKPEPAVESMGLKQLRGAYETTRKERDNLKREIAELKAKPVDDPEKPKLTEKLTQREKELEALRKEMEFVDYERSEDYKKSYEQPYVDAWNRARAKVSEFDAMTEDGSTVRPATAKDFDSIANQPDYRSAKAIAKQLFPDDWQAIMSMRENVLELNEKRVTALDAKRKEGEDVRKQRAEERMQSSKKIQTELATQWKTRMEADHKGNPQYFAPIEGDVKGNELLEKGFEAAHKAFSVMNPMDASLTPSQRQEAIEQHVVAFNKMAAFDRLAYQLVETNKQLKDAQAKLKDFEKSEPQGGDGGPTKTDSAPSDRLSRLGKYAGRAR